jgi:transcription elongation factor GreB
MMNPTPKNYMTPFGWSTMQAELLQLVTKERPQLTEIINWAASNGDRSENGDYIYGKRRLREIDKRIRFLTKRLEAAEVVDPSTRPPTDQIFFGATVDFYRDDCLQRVVIVGQDEWDLSRYWISWISPLARALLKKRIGDTFEFVTAGGVELISIEDVQYLPLSI